MIENVRQPSMSFLHSIDIHQLMPQQEPFVIVSALTAFSQNIIETETIIRADSIFCVDGSLSSFGLIENIAQTCALRIGYINKYILIKDIQFGFIGAIRNFEVLSLPKVGDSIITKVVVDQEMFGMTLANAVVTCKGEKIATMQIKIAVKEDETQANRLEVAL